LGFSMSERDSIGIAAAAEASGLSAHTLRVWERRYGFPVPARTAGGQRFYPADQVHKLGLLRSLGEHGHRPGQLAQRSIAELEQLLVDRGGAPERASDSTDLDAYFRCLAGGALSELRRRLHAALVRKGLARFVVDKLSPLRQHVAAWRQADRITVAQEQVFAVQAERVLREAMTPLEETLPVRIMLATLPGERDGLDLLMIEALFRLEGALCLPVGLETPPAQLAQLAVQSDTDLVVLSFGASSADAAHRRMLVRCRQDLPTRVALWVTGTGPRRVIAHAISGVRVFDGLEQMLIAFRRLRARA
jgi:MerR family transcriptional regulator, light-induced transcriptional regulator